MKKELCCLTDAAKELAVTTARLRQLCQQGRIKGAVKIANTWLIPRPFKIVMSKKDLHRQTKLEMKVS